MNIPIGEHGAMPSIGRKRFFGVALAHRLPGADRNPSHETTSIGRTLDGRQAPDFAGSGRRRAKIRHTDAANPIDEDRMGALEALAS